MKSNLTIILFTFLASKVVVAQEIKSSFMISLNQAQVSTSVTTSSSGSSANSSLQQFPLGSLVRLFSGLPGVVSVVANRETVSQKLFDRGDYREVVREFFVDVNLQSGEKIHFAAQEKIRRCNQDRVCEQSAQVVLATASGETVSTDIKLTLENQIIVDSRVQLPDEVSQAIFDVFSTKKDFTRAQWLLGVVESLGSNNKKLVGELVQLRASL